jgi:hypothetical protein
MLPLEDLEAVVQVRLVLQLLLEQVVTVLQHQFQVLQQLMLVAVEVGRIVQLQLEDQVVLEAVVMVVLEVEQS